MTPATTSTTIQHRPAATGPAAPPAARFTTAAVRLGYDGRVVSDNLDLSVPAGELTAIVGPNACGKSTLLRALARLQAPQQGAVLLDGTDIHRLRTREVARRVGLLPQSAVAPEGMRVRDLVARGRSPHQSLLRQWSAADHDAVERALATTATTDLADRRVDELSGGQRQRVWLALVLAQEAGTVLLDEPTTFLDLAHQLEILELCRRLHADEGRTVVAVLHDLNQAARFATHLVALRDGEIRAEGPPAEILTAELVADVFGLRAIVVPDPLTGTPMVVPYPSATHSAS
ncbi:ABC transporter ATP-binding protein [Sanguibacter sp. HDW7]|uniref:ABC transporter ATP-binding protein n=1 Tax=Sanguibacter sp. HDW7 TaxID=2714931 RepID=UPI00140B874D|nr:ABC transporter ATP-binding protein [Sanguibacter sp. HDW7]QIK83677.1 ABC transporter ATP-binding protein [Sanguibacter sp. HDW7]